jgi:hypothetical protein
MINLLLTLPYLLFLLFLIKKISFFRNSGFQNYSLWFAFLVKVGCGLLVYVIYAFYYGNRLESDTFKYFDDSFYLQNNIPFANRWLNFHVERDLDSEQELFKQYDIKEGEYVFIHDDESRNFNIDESYIINKNLPIIRPKQSLTKNIFDYCYLMENSVESHFIDSSFKLIFDSLKLRNDNIFFHVKLKNGVIKDSTVSQSILNFKKV